MKARTLLDLCHPRHHGIKVQAHHILSGDGVKLSGLGPKLESHGYDINDPPNLAFIPCTLQGACHMGIQPHRGDHTAQADPENDYDDDDEPDSYHKFVAKRVSALLPHMDEKSLYDKPSLCDRLDEVSRDLPSPIQYKPTRAPLTTIADAFSPNSPIGCAGLDNITDKHTGKCPVGRNHLGRQGSSPPQRQENIKYKLDGHYKLEPGK